MRRDATRRSGKGRDEGKIKTTGREGRREGWREGVKARERERERERERGGGGGRRNRERERETQRQGWMDERWERKRGEREREGGIKGRAMLHACS